MGNYTVSVRMDFEAEDELQAVAFMAQWVEAHSWDAIYRVTPYETNDRGVALTDHIDAEDLRTCDTCDRVTWKWEKPDWENGLCEVCDPSLVES